MFEKIYGLTGHPFRLTPERKYYFDSVSHRSAMAYLKYGLREGDGFIVVTGKAGTGKSTLVAKLFSELDFERTVAAQVNATHIDPEDTVKLICEAFGIRAKSSYLEALEAFLTEQNKINRHVLLVVDDAHNLPLETLEALRTLSAFTESGKPLFQSFLIGQPELLATLAKPNMTQLQEKIIGSYRLESLEAQEIRSYISYRLEVAGWSGTPSWTDTAIAIIYLETNGIPRRINMLCSSIMAHAAKTEAKIIDETLVEETIESLKSETTQFKQHKRTAIVAKSSTSIQKTATDAYNTVQNLPQTSRGHEISISQSGEYDVLRKRILTLEQKLAEHDQALREVIDFAVTYLAENQK